MFCDPLGEWLQTTYLLSALTPQLLEDGLPFDASSVKMIRSIEQSDMIMVPDLSTCLLNPWKTPKTAHLIVSIKDPYSDEWDGRDPRKIAEKTVAYVGSDCALG